MKQRCVLLFSIGSQTIYIFYYIDGTNYSILYFVYIGMHKITLCLINYNSL